MKQNIKTMIVALLLMTLIVPVTVSADHTTNYAINTLTLEFQGYGTSTMVIVTVGLNSVAEADSNLVIELYIDSISPANNLVNMTPGTTTITTPWDISRWAEGYHTLIATLRNPTDEVPTDSTADNTLELPFTTQDWFWSPIGEIYGYAQYFVSRVARQQFGGILAFLALYPLWMWIGLVILLAVIIILWRKSRKGRRPIKFYKPAKYYS